MCNSKCLTNPHLSYKHHNVIECSFKETLYLGKSIDWSDAFKRAANHKVEEICADELIGHGNVPKRYWRLRGYFKDDDEEDSEK